MGQGLELGFGLWILVNVSVNGKDLKGLQFCKEAMSLDKLKWTQKQKAIKREITKNKITTITITITITIKTTKITI